MKEIEVVDVQCEVTNKFSDGVYYREVTMPKGSFIVGHEHKTTHLNIVIKGKAKVWMNGQIEYIEAPCTFESKAGTRKILLIEEEMTWATVHVTSETDVDKLTEEIIDTQTTTPQLIEEVKQIGKELLCHGLQLDSQ